MKRAFRKVLAVALASFLSAIATAEEYPDRPVRLVVGFVPGGQPDYVARAMGQKLSQVFGQPVIVDNRPGAGGTIATGYVAKQPADGYTLLLGETVQLAAAPFLFKKLSYDPLKDFVPIARVTRDAVLLVSNPKIPIRSLQDLVREAKASPGRYSYGSSGIGSIHHIAMEVFKAEAGLDIAHVPYKGSGQSLPATLSGEVPLLLVSFGAAAPHLRTGSLNPLAVTTRSRLPSAANIPSLSEVVGGFDYASEIGVLAPAGLPSSIKSKLAAAIKQVAESRDFSDRFKGLGTVIEFRDSKDYAEDLRSDLTRYEYAVRRAKIQAE